MAGFPDFTETNSEHDSALSIFTNQTEEQQKTLELAAQHFVQYTDPEAAIDCFLEQHFDQSTGHWKSDPLPEIPVVEESRTTFNLRQDSSEHIYAQDVKEKSRSPTVDSDSSGTIRGDTPESDDATELGDDDDVKASIYGHRYYCQEPGCPVYRKANRNGKYSMRVHYRKEHPKVKFDSSKLVKTKAKQEVKKEAFQDDDAMFADFDWSEEFAGPQS